MLKTIHAIQSIVVVADSGTDKIIVKDAIEKEMRVKVQSISLINRGDPPTGLNSQPRIMFQATDGLFGALREAGMQYFQVLCTQDITKSFDIIKEAQKAAEKEAKIKAQETATILAREKGIELEVLRADMESKMVEMKKLQANLDKLSGKEPESKKKVSAK